jgi:hypothetical protein
MDHHQPRSRSVREMQPTAVQSILEPDGIKVHDVSAFNPIIGSRTDSLGECAREIECRKEAFGVG